MVLIRIDEAWVPANLTSFTSETMLQELLHRDISLIPGCAGAAVVRELVIPGVGKADLVCVDSEGFVTIIECKLKANREIRREIVGQIIAYASGLAGSTYDEFDAAFTARGGESLLESVSVAAGAAVDASALRVAVADRLASGAFRLVVAVDQITVELRRSVEYLNQHLSDSVLVMALELGYLKHEGVEVLVPRVYGAELESIKRRGQTAAARHWTADEVAEAVAAITEPAARDAVERLLSHAARHNASMKGGTGAVPSAGYYYTVAGTRRSVWSLYVKPNDPTVAINLGSIANTSPSLAEAVAAQLVTAPAFANRLGSPVAAVVGKYPEFGITTLLQDPKTMDVLQRAFDLAIAAPNQDNQRSPLDDSE